MATFESIQRRIDTRYIQAQRNMDEIAMNGQGSFEDLVSFFHASQSMASASLAMTEQTRFKHSLTKAIIDGVQ
ncbi:type III secretion protein [Pseudomonas sp.]|uniref:type III secretion protein n=1 Tax=Pseudomonas sp. TaxID=306 RepID=UPI002613FB94|nr:type III secretion protein [Pseudomonas sp.]